MWEKEVPEKMIRKDELQLLYLADRIRALILMTETLKLHWNWEPTWPEAEAALEEARYRLQALYARLIADREEDRWADGEVSKEEISKEKGPCQENS